MSVNIDIKDMRLGEKKEEETLDAIAIILFLFFDDGVVVENKGKK